MFSNNFNYSSVRGRAPFSPMYKCTVDFDINKTEKIGIKSEENVKTYEIPLLFSIAKDVSKTEEMLEDTLR